LDTDSTILGINDFAMLHLNQTAFFGIQSLYAGFSVLSERRGRNALQGIQRGAAERARNFKPDGLPHHWLLSLTAHWAATVDAVKITALKSKHTKLVASDCCFLTASHDRAVACIAHSPRC
jgi:hypothetical protein